MEDPGDDGLGPLPDGWEMQKTKGGKQFFIDHNSKRTTADDPRFTHLAPESPPKNQSNKNNVSQDASIPENASVNKDSGDDGLGPLPDGWEMQKTKGGKRFFIDHNNKRTTTDDPRSRSTDLASMKRKENEAAAIKIQRKYRDFKNTKWKKVIGIKPHKCIKNMESAVLNASLIYERQKTKELLAQVSALSTRNESIKQQIYQLSSDCEKERHAVNMLNNERQAMFSVSSPIGVMYSRPPRTDESFVCCKKSNDSFRDSVSDDQFLDMFNLDELAESSQMYLGDIPLGR
eukprot:UC4_evm5s1249